MVCHHFMVHLYWWFSRNQDNAWEEEAPPATAGVKVDIGLCPGFRQHGPVVAPLAWPAPSSSGPAQRQPTGPACQQPPGHYRPNRQPENAQGQLPRPEQPPDGSDTPSCHAHGVTNTTPRLGATPPVRHGVTLLDTLGGKPQRGGEALHPTSSVVHELLSSVMIKALEESMMAQTRGVSKVPSVSMHSVYIIVYKFQLPSRKVF